MNLRWLLFDYADPALPLSFWKRQKITWRPIPIWKMPKSLRRGRILCIAFGIAPFAIATPFMPFLFNQLIRLSHNVTWYPLVVLYIAVVWSWGCFIYGLTSRTEHYYRIRLEGYDVCLGCGYWLRGLDETIRACPECGTDRIAFDEDDHLKARS
ncbi:MAG: hypothetical protein IH984_14180 [Planctomycetes bacterium]|nr:hypothetical protein [Planctomycetota bacterium]